MASREVEKRTVGRVFYAGPAHSQMERRWVRCARQEGSVPFEQCESCSHLVSVEADEHERALAVYCEGPSADSAGETDAQGSMLLPRVPISELMTRNVMCVRPDMSLDALIALFVETGLRAVPVVGEDGMLLGVVSETDAMLDVHARGSVDASGWMSPASAAEPSTKRVRDVESVMSPLAIALPENTPVSRAAAVMVFEHASRVAVISPDGEVVGILAAVDVMFWLAQADGYLLGSHGRESE